MNIFREKRGNPENPDEFSADTRGKTGNNGEIQGISGNFRSHRPFTPHFSPFFLICQGRQDVPSYIRRFPAGAFRAPDLDATVRNYK